MGVVINGGDMYEVVIPVVCFAVCVSFQAWEFAGKHNEIGRARTVFKDVREGWVKANKYTGQAAANTTRDYIRAALFFSNTSILLTTFAVGYAGTRYAGCQTEQICSAEDWLLIVKLGVLSAVFFTIFFVFTQCTRFAVHFSFCINTKEINGVPLPESLMVNVFNHSYKYHSLGIRLYFGTIPVFAWIFTPWALLAVTPVYLFMVHGLENANFLHADMKEIERLTAVLPASLASSPGALMAGQSDVQQGSDTKEHAV